MKYYSEELKQMYDDEQTLKEAEAAHKEALARKEAEQKKINSAASREKKELATAIDLAEESLNKAYADYAEAKESAKKIYLEANEKATALIKTARDAVSDAQRAKYKAISNFNNKFGPYTTSYTGDKALQEFNRVKSWIFDIGNMLF